jgi:superfamily II DNA helicase RecQ
LIDFRGELPKTKLDLGPVLQVLGKAKLRDGQLSVILAILAGRNVLAVRPTGSGKSLCFQIPILLSPGTGLVIEPLKALMKDQVQGLHALQLPATFISSDVPLGERRRRLHACSDWGSWGRDCTRSARLGAARAARESRCRGYNAATVDVSEFGSLIGCEQSHSGSTIDCLVTLSRVPNYWRRDP